MEIPRLCRGGSSSLTFRGVPRSGSVVSSHSHERNRTEGRVRDAKPYDVGLQIFRGFHPEVSAQGAVSGTEETAGRGFSSARGSEGVIAHVPIGVVMRLAAAERPGA